MTELRVLFIEDREDDAMLVLRELRHAGFDVDHDRVETAEDMLRALNEREWDLIISDFSMPRFTGPAALEILKSTKLDIPFIMVSGTVGEDAAVAALKAGAHDFLSKRNFSRLVPALERELREARGRRERRHAEARLRESESALEAVFRASPLPIVTVDMQDRVTAWNPAAERVFGYAAEAMLGHTPPFPTSVDQNEIAWQRKDGTTIRIIISASALEDRSGNRSGTIAVVTNITEQRALEEQFRQAQKMEAVGQLAGGIAHDFNNILTAIQGYATLTLSDLSRDDRHYQDIQEISDAASRAASLTRQLLTFSRKQVTQPELLDTNEVIANLRNMLGRVIGDHYSIQLELGADTGPIFADRGLIEQIVMNLVVNARDAMPAGGAIVVCSERVRARPHQNVYGDGFIGDGPFTVIRVRDTGQGIPPDMLARIFEPFFTTKEPGKGTGLGLSTVYGIVVQNKGFIAVDSEPGQGTEFSVYLPEPDGAPVKTNDLVISFEMDDYLPLTHCLVVEDDEIVSRLIARTLERAGFAVRTTDDPAAALELLEADSDIDVLITDMMLPGMTGANLIAVARSRFPKIKTVLISGYSSEDLAVPAHYAFLEKPFTPDALVHTVRSLLLRKDEPESAD